MPAIGERRLRSTSWTSALSGDTYSTRSRSSGSAGTGSPISRSRHQRKAARVLPLPVGAQMSVCSPAAMAGQPRAWAAVGTSNDERNQSLVAGRKAVERIGLGVWDVAALRSSGHWTTEYIPPDRDSTVFYPTRAMASSGTSDHWQPGHRCPPRSPGGGVRAGRRIRRHGLRAVHRGPLGEPDRLSPPGPAVAPGLPDGDRPGVGPGADIARWSRARTRNSNRDTLPGRQRPVTSEWCRT